MCLFLDYCQHNSSLCTLLLSFWQSCLGPLMNILREHIVGMEKEHLIAHQSELTAFFMKALDFRTEHAQVTCLGDEQQQLNLCMTISMQSRKHYGLKQTKCALKA